jgi:tetratricopeptide (TPR) repeat protein
VRAAHRVRPSHAVVAGLALAWALQCRKHEEIGGSQSAPLRAPPATTQPGIPPIVDYGRCASTREDGSAGATPRCIFEHEREFRLWFEREHVGELEVHVDGRRVSTRRLAPVDDKSRGLGIELPEGATRLEVGFSARAERWVLPLRARSCAECHDAGAHGRAAERFEALMADPSVRGDWRRELVQVLDLLEREGLLEDRIDLIHAAAFTLGREHAFDQAAELLSLAAPLAARSPRLHAKLAYASGVLDWRRGRSGSALTSLRTASLHAMRLDDLEIGVAALPMYAELLAEQGYFRAALRWSQLGLAWARAVGDPCRVASTLRTTAWVRLLLARDAGPEHGAAPLLTEALALIEPGGECPWPDRIGGARASLAMLALQDGEPREALDELRTVAVPSMTPAERVLATDVELQARLALGHDVRVVERAMERLEQAVEDAGTVDARWYLALRRGQALEARGEREMALEAYREAEEHLDGIAQLAAFGVGRDAVGASHRESSERLVDVLLALEREGDALCVARQAEARRIQGASLPPSLPEEERARLERRVSEFRVAQASLEELSRMVRDVPTDALAEARARVDRQRRDLEREADEILGAAGRHARAPSCDALHRPGPSELLIGLLPRGDGWLVFAEDAEAIRVHAVDLREADLEVTQERLSELLLRPMADQIRKARRIRVHAIGRAQRIDVHLLPWDGKPLVASAAVVYGVDVVAAEPRTSRERASGPRAVLLADPTGSLPEAEQEIRDAREQLERSGWHVDVIASEDARPHGVQERMAGATLLHYAGHAEHDELLDPGWWPPYPGGTASWPASLRLADGTRLAAHEILMRPGRVPAKVILSGCRTGAVDAAAGGTSLAVAFLVAGAEEVIATSAVTGDAEAREVVRAVYEELGRAGAGEWSLGEALARGQARSIAAGETVGRYRAWVR